MSESSAGVTSNKAIKFAPAYGLRRTASPLRVLSAAYRDRWASGTHPSWTFKA